MTAELVVRRDGDVAVFRLNRPTSGNSLSPGLVEALHAGLDEFEQNGGRVLMLEGQGRNFCTGFDLSDLAEVTDAELVLRFVRIELLLARLWTAPFATIAVGTGRLIGAGADLFTACGRRFAVDGATFRFPGAAFGLVLGTRRLATRIGPPAAEHLVAQGLPLSAVAATEAGLATARVAAADLPALIREEIATATRLDVATFASVRRAAGGSIGELDADLAILVRSAARPGLRERMLAYRASLSKAQGQPLSQH